ncbi:NAD(+)/NADH kinase [Adhaeribacter swui]|uniref:NAD(+)/NADH kinase n=1 Tax=Adhaeribacter swui TaxID=2086471 RepID=A0A7G7GCZ5_9BACT|nr:diacylglycerol kinase family protein [Adhaeribacter swui]QNF35029.1 NAD(+)/NADH kinase [Adhaeribacter swui]
MAANSRFKKLLFVINPISGDVDKSDLEDAIAQYGRSHQLEFKIYKTSGEDDFKKLKNLLSEYGPDAVFAAGGDGTVSLTARVVKNSDVPLGIIPVGSGNGLSKDLGIPQTIEEALTLITNHAIKAIDTLELNGHPCFHISDLGFNALVVARYSEAESRGPQTYAFIALQEYLDYECHEYRVETDQEVFEGAAFMITITNSNAFGSNVKINPNGVIDDGIFEICLIESFPKMAAFKIMYNLYAETPENSEFTRILSCREATIYNYTDTLAQIDGEVVELGKKITIKQLPKSLRVVVPAE